MTWRIGSLAAASGGMVLFALFAHRGLPWIALAAGGALAAALAIARSGPPAHATAPGSAASPAELFGLGRLSLRTVLFALAGAALGAGAGAWHRYGLDLPLQPAAGIQPFVIVACAIGAGEELLYRGWLLGQARAFGWPAAVVVAALTHAAYKTALFAWPPAPVSVDLWELLWITALAGGVLGALRVWSRSVLPAVVAHVVFDFVVYRGVTNAPWWVWG